jgi:hypothetical protein
VGRGARAFRTTPPTQREVLAPAVINQLFVFLMPMFYADDRISMKWLAAALDSHQSFVGCYSGS